MRMTRKIRRAWLRGKPEWAKCYLLKQRLRKQTQIIEFNKPQSRLHNYSRYLVAGVMLACLGIGQGVASASEITASSGVPNNVVKNNNVYNIYNQQVNNGSALNKFDKFNLSTDDIANLQLDQHTVKGITYQAADRQINLVNDRVVIDGVLNSFKDGKIGGDIYFFSDKGIAVGATGVVNVGSLTLGTNASAGKSIFDDFTYYANRTSLDKAMYIAGSGDVTVDGTINSVNGILIGSDKVTVSNHAKINSGVDFSNINPGYDGLTMLSNYRAQFMNLNGVDSASLAVKANNGEIVLFGKTGIDFSTEDTINIIGTTNDNRVQLITDGGDINISATRESMGDTKIEIANAILDAQDKSVGTANGNVNVTASTITETFSWAMDGSDATVNITDSKLIGDNVTVSALASTVGKLDADTVNNTNEEIDAAIESSDHRVLQAIKDLAVDTGLEVRTLATGTKVHANAKVNILDSDLTAIGGSKGDANTTHGDINVNAVAASEVTTMGLGALAFSATAGISDVNAHINIGSKKDSNKGSSLDAANDVILNANGSNKVDLYYLDIAFVDGLVYSGAATNWAEVNSDIKINVDGNSEIKATNDVSITAESIRTLINYACSGGDADYLGVTTSISLANTNAEAIVNGDIYANGDVNVSAKNSVAQKDGYYIPDTSIAESLSGDTFTGKAVAVGLKKTISALAGKITDGKTHIVDIEAVPSKGKEFGLNAATSVLSSINSAKAEVNGDVKSRAEDGAAANSLTVTAENISRSNVIAMAYQNELTKVSDGSIANTKDYGVASGVSVGVQKNSASASVNGNVNVANNLIVKSETKVPWESETFDSKEATAFSIITKFITNLFTDGTAGLSSGVVDSWAQSNNSTEKAAMAASIGVMEYKNESTAYIGKNAQLTVGGELDVSALNEIVTANFAGNISSPVSMIPLGALWKHAWGYDKEIISPNLWAQNTEYASLGGSAVAVHQTNKASAYIADRAEVTSTRNVDVKADNRAANIVITAAGGKSDGVTLDATIGVTRTENSAYAYIGNANVNSSNNVNVNATDQAIIANIGGAIDESGGTVGIGGTVAYNHMERDTQAYILGHVTANNGVAIEAKNTGEIIAASVAGSVTVGSVADTASGSAGLQATDNNNVMREVEKEKNLKNTVEDLLNNNITDDNNKKNIEVDTGKEALSNASENSQGALSNNVDNSEGANVNVAQNGFAVAANIAVNKINDNAQAFIDKKENAPTGSSVTADYVRVTSVNDSEIASLALSAAVDFSTGKASTGIAGSFMYNAITSQNNAYVKNATLALSGNTEENKDEALSITAQNAEYILNLAGSGSVAPKGNAIVGQISVNDISNTNNAYLQDSIVRAAEKVSVTANNSAQIDSLTGAMSLTGGAFAVGAAVGVQDVDNVTTANISSSEITGLVSSTENTSYNKGGSVEVTAQEQSEVTSIVAAGSIGMNTAMAAEAAVSVSDVDTATSAYIDSDENIKAAAINIAARNLANATVGVGQIGTGKNAFGAASATMLSKNSVEAYLKGDTAKTKLIEADSMNVEAENIYNGSANNSDEDDTTAKIVAVGGAVGTNAAAGTGSATVNIIDNDTKAHIDVGNYNVNGAVNVNAQSAASMFGLAGGVSVAKAAGVGAAVDTQLLNVDTQAFIADNVTISKAGNITVKADSIEKITSVAAVASIGGYFAGAAAVNAHDVDVNIEAYIGTDTATSKTVLGSDTSKVGNISVTASDDATLSTNAGSAPLEVGSGGAAIGGSAAVELLDKSVKASIGNADVYANNLNVRANNIGNLITTANGIAVAATAYGAAGTGSASESIVNYVTDAHIADGSTITVANDVVVDANSNFEHRGVATAFAGSSWVGIGLSNDTTVLNMDTLSYVGDGNISAGDDVSITADNKVEITSAVASGGGGIAAIDGGVGVNVITNETKAYIESGSEVSADNSNSNDLNGIELHAQDDTKLEGGSGGATLGAANAGASVNVNDISKNTQAYIGSNAVLNSKGATTIEAINNENISNVTVQGTGGLTAELAGAVAVHNLDVNTQSYTGNGVNINQSSGYENEQAVSLTANHSVTLNDTVVSGAIGIGAVAGSVSVINLGTGNNTEAVKQLNDSDEQSFDTWLNEQINQSNTSKYLAEYGDNTVAQSVKGAVDEREFDTSVTNSSTSSEAGTIAQFGANSAVNASTVNVNAKNDVDVDVSVGTGSAGGLAVGASVGVVNNNGNVSAIVDAGAGITSSNTTSILAEDNSDINGFAVTPAAGIIAGSAAALDLNSAVDVNTFINNSASISAQSISVQALNTPKLNAYATGVGVGIAGVGTVEALLSSKDSASVTVGDSVTLTTTGTSDDEGKVEILAATKKAEGYNAYVKAEAGSGGVVAGSVTVSQIELDNDTNVTIGQNGSINGKKISILAKHEDAFNYENLSAGAAGVSGLGSDNRVTVTSDVKVSIGESSDGTSTADTSKASITSSEETTIKAENTSLKNWLNASGDNAVGEADYNALSAGASLAGGAGIVNKTNITHNTDVTLGEVIVKANALNEENNAIAIDAYSKVTSKDYQYIGTGAVIEAAEIDDDNIITANTAVNVGAGTKLHAGSIDLANQEISNVPIEQVSNTTIKGGNISIGARNDADLYSKTYVNTWGGVGVVGSTNDVTYEGSTNVNFNGYAETADGDVRLGAGRDSSGVANSINATADSTLLNGTVVPISHTSDPTANISSASKIIVGNTANIKSDADVYLQSNTGTLNAKGFGEVHDWAHGVGEAFGSTSWKTGSQSTITSADVEVNGTVETGIHRNWYLKIEGTNQSFVDDKNTEDKNDDTIVANWETSFNSYGNISFDYDSSETTLHNRLSQRLQELRDLRADYIADQKSVDVYDAEINLIQEQMVLLGLGYYQTETVKMEDGTTNKVQTFVECHTPNTILSSPNINMLYTPDEATALSTKINEYIANCDEKLKENTDVEYYEQFKDSLIKFQEQFNLTENSEAYYAFIENGGKINADGDFTLSDGTIVNSYTKNPNGSFTFNSVPRKSNSSTSVGAIEIKDITLELGSIKIEGDNLYGSGNLTANNDASVTITNASPNDLIVNDIKIVGTGSTNDKIYDGAVITFNSIRVSDNAKVVEYNKDKSKNVGLNMLSMDNPSNEPQITIHSTFEPSEHLVSNVLASDEQNTNISDTAKLFIAPSVTIKEGALIENYNGKVKIESDYGDVYNYGTIDAETVEIKVANGSYVQELVDDESIVNIGGDPGEIYDTNNKVLTSGIFANGDITINARYVNINSTIQSGKAEWELIIPNFDSTDTMSATNISVYWYENGEEQVGTLSYVANDGFKLDTNNYQNVDNGLIYFKEDSDTEQLLGNAYQYLSYDLNNNKFVLDGLNINGGNVEITGTILNTSSDGKGKIVALDGYGTIDIQNKSRYDLELRNISTGNGDKGKITITDLDRETGNRLKTTTYESFIDLDGQKKIQVSVKEKDNTLYTTVDTNDAKYTPQNNYYIWQSGQDNSTVTEYHYTDSQAVIWWKDGEFSDKDLAGMDVVSVTTGDNYELKDGTIISNSIANFYDADGNKISDLTSLQEGTTVYYGTGEDRKALTIVSVPSTNGDYTQYKYEVTTSTSDPYDERTETHRVWYTAWLLKEYDHWFKIKEGTTTITQNSLKANHSIGIEFIGNESGGLTVTGKSADVILNGMISNVAGTTSISADDIVQGNNGYIKTDSLVLNATNNVGTVNDAVQTNAANLTGYATNGAFAVEVLHNGVNLGNISAGGTAYIKATGDITQTNDAKITAQRVELYSQTGGIGTASDTLDVKVSAPTDGVKNAAYGLKAEANDGIYITNSNGDLYLDSVISKNGDVVLTTNGSFIDNNFTDIVDKDAAEKLTAFTNAQVLENQKTTANLQKQMLVNSAQNKYNRYQALKKYIVVDEDGNISFNLTDLDRAALEKAEFDEAAIQQYVADRIAEYKDLVNQGADNWTETALTSYKDSINNTDVTSNIMAKASLSEDALQGHRFASENGIEFLTVEEKAEILVGSARSQKELLVSTAPGTLKEVTDTNLIIKTVPNVKGKNVTLTATGDTSGIGSVKEMSGVIPSNIDEILIKNSDEWTEADKQAVALYEAYLAAERGDVTKYVVNDDGSIDLTVKVVDSIDITASGAVNVNAPMHVYLTSEADVRLDTISSNGEVRLKANGSIIGTKDEAGSSTSYKGTVTSGERVVLESAQGSINGITLSEATNSAQDEQHELIARAAKDISISKADDLVVDIVHSANGKVTLDVGGEDETANNITAYGSDENGNEVNISGVNIELLGVDDLGEATNNIGLKGRVGKDVTDGKITATVAGEVYIDTFGNINNPEISGQAIDHLNLGSINGGEVIATATNINLVNKGSIIGTSFVAANGAVDYKTVEDTVSEDVTINAGSNVTVDAGDDASFANITAQETVDIDGEANVTVNEVTAQNLNVDVNKDITIGTADVQQEATLNSGSNITADTVTAQNLDVNAGNTFKGNNISAVDVNIVAGKDIIISSEDVTDSLAGVVDNDPATFIGSDLSAGHLTAELRKDYTTFADDKGNGVLSATGKLNLQAGDSVAIDTLLTEDNVAQIKANIVGIDDAQNLGTGATEIQVNGSKGEAAYYVGIGTSDNNTLQLSDSNVEQLVLNAKDNVQVKNTYVNGDGSISAGKVLVGITNNPHNEYSLKIGELTISDDEVTSSEKFAYVLDGIDLNGSHRTETKVRVSERSLFTNDDHSSKQAEENEKEESKIKDTSITFGTVSENEAFQKI